jgi:hypothetical protein
MRQNLMASGLVGMLAAMLLTFAAPSYADAVQFNADLKGSSEVPPNQATGSGSLTATFDTVTKQLSWKGNFSRLSGAANAAHFHGPADPGKNAGVIVWISTKGTPLDSPFEGSATLADDQVSALMAGRLYVNVHTTANPGGELRGQLTKM